MEWKESSNRNSIVAAMLCNSVVKQISRNSGGQTDQLLCYLAYKSPNVNSQGFGSQYIQNNSWIHVCIWLRIFIYNRLLWNLYYGTVTVSSVLTKRFPRFSDNFVIFLSVVCWLYVGPLIIISLGEPGAGGRGYPYRLLTVYNDIIAYHDPRGLLLEHPNSSM
jgi:hypothetical protein